MSGGVKEGVGEAIKKIGSRRKEDPEANKALCITKSKVTRSR